MLFLVEAFARKVGVSGRFLQNCVGRDHFAGNEVLPDAEVFERTLGLRAPELVGRDVYLAEAVRFLANCCHLIFSFRLEHLNAVAGLCRRWRSPLGPKSSLRIPHKEITSPTNSAEAIRPG